MTHFLATLILIGGIGAYVYALIYQRPEIVVVSIGVLMVALYMVRERRRRREDEQAWEIERQRRAEERKKLKDWEI